METPLSIEPAFLGDWYVNMFTVDRRKTLIYMNEILDDGGFESCNVGEIIRQMNRMPQRNLGWKNSVSTLQQTITKL